MCGVWGRTEGGREISPGKWIWERTSHVAVGRKKCFKWRKQEATWSMATACKTKNIKEACALWDMNQRAESGEVREGNRCDVGCPEQPTTSSDFELSPSHVDSCTGLKVIRFYSRGSSSDLLYSRYHALTYFISCMGHAVFRDLGQH